MPYKRPTPNSKKYISPFYMPNYSPNPSYSMNTADLSQKKDLFGIPLPNESESVPESTAEKRFVPSLSGFVKFLRQHVKIEDIILIGLIILMLDEAIEDDLLLILLIYILLF